MNIKNLRPRLKKLMALTSAIVMMVGAVANADTGLQAVGFANWTANDVNATSTIYRNVGGNLEMAFLPFEFNPGNPFGNATQFVKNVLPGRRVRLRITVQLLYRTDHQLIIPADYSYRVRQFDAWTVNMRNWANANGVGDLLGITLSPMLEDNTYSYSAYSQLLNNIVQIQNADRVSVGFRRITLNSAFRVGAIPHEYHGSNYGSLPFYAYDRWSNDGSEMTEAQFTTGQRTLLSRNVSSLYWTASFNGRDRYSSATPPSQRTNLSPFGGNAYSAAGQMVQRIMSAR